MMKVLAGRPARQVLSLSGHVAFQAPAPKSPLLQPLAATQHAAFRNSCLPTADQPTSGLAALASLSRSSRRGWPCSTLALPHSSTDCVDVHEAGATADGSGPSSQPAQSQPQPELPPCWEWGKLSSTAKVALFTGAYITVFGMAALLFPRQLLGLLFPASVLGTGWVRVGATLAILFGAYYLGAAVDDIEGRKPLRMYQSTVLGRLLLAVVFGWLVVRRECGAGLLLLAAANAAGAWRMAAALHSDGVAWRWRWRGEGTDGGG